MAALRQDLRSRRPVSPEMLRNGSRSPDLGHLSPPDHSLPRPSGMGRDLCDRIQRSLAPESDLFLGFYLDRLSPGAQRAGDRLDRALPRSLRGPRRISQENRLAARPPEGEIPKAP